MTSFDLPESSGIYCIRNTVNGKIYVGSAVNLRKRCYEHFRLLRLGTHSNSKLQLSFTKHGESSFVSEVLELVLVPEMLTAREQAWFSKLRPFGRRGYNLSPTAGSTLGVKASAETRVKQSLAKKGKPGTSRGRKATPEQIERNRLAHLGQKVSDEARRKIGEKSRGRTHRPETLERMRQAKMGHEVSQETRDKISAINRGNPSPMRGKTHSAEARTKIGEAGRGRIVSPVTREKLSQAGRGRKLSPESVEKRTQSRQGFHHTPETREKLRLASLGNTNMLGKPMPQQTREKLRERNKSRMKTLIITDPNGVEHMVCGVRQFCKEHGLDRSNLMHVAKGNKISHKGYKARYAD